jgi:hypothetical protein
MPITGSINVSKLDKSRFIKGEKGVYVNLILIETPESEYGDYICKQDMKKEDRESGAQTPILGNFKNRNSKGKAKNNAPESDDDSEIPF